MHSPLSSQKGKLGLGIKGLEWSYGTDSREDKTNDILETGCGLQDPREGVNHLVILNLVTDLNSTLSPLLVGSRNIGWSTYHYHM